MENAFSEDVDLSEIEFWRVEILETVLIIAMDVLAGELYENHEAKCGEHRATNRALILAI